MNILLVLNLIIIVLASIGLGYSLGFKHGCYIGTKTAIEETIEMIEKKITDDSFKEEYKAIIGDTFSLDKLDLNEEDYKIEKLQ